MCIQRQINGGVNDNYTDRWTVRQIIDRVHRQIDIYNICMYISWIGLDKYIDKLWINKQISNKHIYIHYLKPFAQFTLNNNRHKIQWSDNYISIYFTTYLPSFLYCFTISHTLPFYCTQYKLRATHPSIHISICITIIYLPSSLS